MNSSQTLLFDQVQAKGQNSPKRIRLFYSGTAALLLALMFLGFPQFYLHGRTYPNSKLAPPIRTLLILHSIGMTAWALLIVAGNHRVHISLNQ